MKFGIFVYVAAAALAMGCTQKETVVQKVEPKKEKKIIQDDQELVIDVTRISFVLEGEVADPEGAPQADDPVVSAPETIMTDSQREVHISVNDGLTPPELQMRWAHDSDSADYEGEPINLNNKSSDGVRVVKVENSGEKALRIKDEQLDLLHRGYRVGQVELKYFKKMDEGLIEVQPVEALEHYLDPGYDQNRDHDDEMLIRLKEGYVAQQKRSWRIIVPGSIVNHLLRVADAETLASANIVIQGESINLASIVANNMKKSEYLVEDVSDKSGGVSRNVLAFDADGKIAGSLQPDCGDSYGRTLENFNVVETIMGADMVNAGYYCFESDSGEFLIDSPLEIELINLKVQ